MIIDDILKKIQECSCQEPYNASAGSEQTNPNRPDYTDRDNLEPEQKPDVTRNANWVTNPVLNNKEDIMNGVYALEQYSSQLKDLIIKMPSSFCQTPQFQDILNEFNQAFNKALLNVSIAKDTALTFEALYNPRPIGESGSVGDIAGIDNVQVPIDGKKKNVHVIDVYDFLNSFEVKENA